MSKYIDPDVLKAEIERLKGYISVTHFAEELLSFIDSLQQEQPSEDLTTEIEKYFQGLWLGMETAEQCNTDMHFTPPAIMRLANHFYELGKQSKEPVSEDLEEAAEKKFPVYWKNYPKDGIVRSESSYDTNKQCRDAFLAGANWQKEQMLKDAVETDVDDLNGDVFNYCIERGLTTEDKVKIIIVKEDKK